MFSQARPIRRICDRRQVSGRLEISARMAPSHTARVVRDLEASRDVLEAALADQHFVDTVARTATIIIDALRAGRKILFAGNGGRAAGAQHLATELAARF